MGTRADAADGDSVIGLEGVEYALTLICPWAVLVTEGPKDIENRAWTPPPWIVGKRIGIHAGKKYDEDGHDAAVEILSRLRRGGMSVEPSKWRFRDIRGAIIGTAVVTGYVTQSTSPWFCGPCGWTLADRKPLRAPLFCRGLQKLWRIPSDPIDRTVGP